MYVALLGSGAVNSPDANYINGRKCWPLLRRWQWRAAVNQWLRWYHTAGTAPRWHTSPQVRGRGSVVHSRRCGAPDRRSLSDAGAAALVVPHRLGHELVRTSGHHAPHLLGVRPVETLP